MNEHICNQCDGSNSGHKLSWVHGRDSKECCFCNQSLNPFKPAQDVPEDTKMKTLTFEKDGKTITFQGRGAESFTFGGEHGFSAHAKDGSAIPFEVITNEEKDQ
jgi:hypothetical protein